MPQSSPVSARLDYVHLDMLRGLAALGVFANHARAFLLPNYQQLQSPGPAEAAFWFATGLGHQSVMVFFVLSGFFIARSIVQDHRRGSFSWPAYLTKRLTRLWVVLLPCLVLTYLLDTIGARLSSGDFYAGRLFDFYVSGPSVKDSGVDLSFAAFLGNLFFLQTIAAPVYGSNGPLWSLAYEFWYYLIFPLLYSACLTTTGMASRLVMVAASLAIGILVGWKILLYGSIWLLGVCAYRYSDALPSRRSSLMAGASAIALAFALVVSRTGLRADYLGDLFIGIATAGLVLGLAGLRTPHVSNYSRLARILADASYTIYLFHFPFLALVVSVVLGNEKLPTTIGAYLTVAFISAGTLAYCYAAYWLFERRTEAVRRLFLPSLIPREGGRRM